MRKGGATSGLRTPTTSDRAEASEEEREALMNQLKILGYMD